MVTDRGLEDPLGTADLDVAVGAVPAMRVRMPQARHELWVLADTMQLLPGHLDRDIDVDLLLQRGHSLAPLSS